MKKVITILTSAILLTSLTGCLKSSALTVGSVNGAVLSASQKATEPQQIEAAIVEALGDGCYCVEPISEEELTLSIFNGLDLSKIESYAAVKAPGDKRDMIAIFKYKHGYADELVEILNNYFAEVVTETRKDRVDVLKVNGTRIYKIGDIVMFILAGKSPESGISTDEEAALAEAEYAKIDRVIKNFYGMIPENLAEITMDPSWARG